MDVKPTHPKVIYDANCEFCRLVKDVVEKYDGGSLDFTVQEHGSTNGTDADGSQAAIAQKDRLTILDQSGNFSSDGIDSMIFLSRKVKVFFPLLPLLLLLKFIGIGQLAYDFVARNRYLASRLMGPALGRPRRP